MNEPSPIHCTLGEALIYQIALTIEDGVLAFHGFGSPLVQLALHLAKHTHAPNLALVAGATYGVNPTPPFLAPTSNDWVMDRGAECHLGIEELFDLAASGRLGRMFLSGLQIDRWGNLNVTRLGRERLQLVDEGRYLNGDGETVHCSCHVLIATTNAGSQVFRQKAAVLLGAQVVGGPVVLRVAGGREKEAGLGIEAAPGEELEGEIGVGGASHAQVDLQGEDLPGLVALVARDEEVHPEAADHAVAGQRVPDPDPLVLDEEAILVGGGEVAPLKDLTAGPPQDLVVGGDGHHLAAGAEAHLGRGGLLLHPVQVFLDDAAHPRELVVVGLRSLARHGELHALKGLVQGPPAAPLGVAEDGVAFSGEALVELDDRLAESGAVAAEIDEHFLDLMLGVEVLGT